MHLGNLYEHPSIEKIKSQKIYKSDAFHVMQLQIKKDEILKPHHSTTDAFLVVIEGEIIFNMQDENFHLHKGDMLSFGKYITHSVKAIDDSILLVIK